MQWKKKICIRITARRIAIAIVIAASSVNLIIVGAAFEAASTATPTPTSFSPTQTQTMTSGIPTAIPWNTTIPISSPTEMLTLTNSPTSTSTPTATPTSTPTNPPAPTRCLPRSYWFAYYVQSGDTLYALALSTGSTVDELRLANCLAGTLILRGQILYVPRLPIKTPIPTATDSPKPDLPPAVRIISAKVGSNYAYDQESGLWYSNVVLEGNATDFEDGVLPDSSLYWSTDRTDIYQNPSLGKGSSVEAVLYSNVCTGVWHTITLTATDSRGNVAIATVRIFIGTSLC